MKRICSIYRCSKKEGMYLYVDKQDDLESLPDPLRKQIGQTELAMSLLLTEDKKLARADVKDVLAAIEKQGFYLQMPPSILDAVDKDMQVLRQKNSKLS